MPAASERLVPAWWLVLALGLFVPTSALIFLPLSPLLGITVGFVLWFFTVALLWWSAPSVHLDADELRAGKARINRRFIARVDAYDGPEAVREKGVNLDARAFVVIRPWVHPVVKITLRDDDDPTPYWLVSTRQPDQWVARLGQDV